MESHVRRDERLNVIENLLFQRPDGVRVVELADVCGVDRRTIYRDMAKLRADGVPIYQKRGRFFVSREHYNANVQLSLHETIALFTAVRVLAQLADQQNPHAISALNKLSAGLPDAMAAHVTHIAARLRQQPVDRLFVTVAETLTRAWREQRWARFWTGQTKHAIELAPYFLEAAPTGEIYVVGREAATERVRAFQLSHIVRAELLPTKFRHPSDFDPDAYLADVTGIVPDESPKQVAVVLACQPEYARLLMAKRVRIITRHETAPDGRILLTLHVSDWREIMAWVRTLNTAVEVIQPAAMRRAIAEEARRMNALYAPETQSET